MSFHEAFVQWPWKFHLKTLSSKHFQCCPHMLPPDISQMVPLLTTPPWALVASHPLFSSLLHFSSLAHCTSLPLFHFCHTSLIFFLSSINDTLWIPTPLPSLICSSVPPHSPLCTFLFSELTVYRPMWQVMPQSLTLQVQRPCSMSCQVALSHQSMGMDRSVALFAKVISIE